jgi:hypothetical protein
MTTARAFSPLLGSALLIALTAGQSRAEYCPQYVVGQWNGVWWHWCLDCANQPATVYATDTRMHSLGDDCMSIRDPIKFQMKLADLGSKPERAKDLRIAPNADGDHLEPEDNLTPDLNAKQVKFVPQQKKGGAKGESPDKVDSFPLGSKSWIIYDDRMIKVKDKPGNYRYFRVLLLKPNDKDLPKIGSTTAAAIGIGQETEPNDVDDVKDEYYCKKRFGPQQIIVTEKADGAGSLWHVSTMFKFVKP